MFEELELLEEVEATSSKTRKLVLLEKGLGDNKLRELLDACFNFHRKFFIKALDSTPTPVDHNVCLHYEFMALLTTLEGGKHRGNVANQMVLQFLSNCNNLQKKWYMRIIKKDLKAGFSLSTCNKVGFNIPEFKVMLATDSAKCKKIENIVNAGVWISPKLDGYRCLAIINNGNATLYSRNGKVYENFPQIIASLEACFPDDNYVFDGEIMSDDFESMQRSAFANKRGTTVGDVKYHIFDFIPYQEWISSEFHSNKDYRLQALRMMSRAFDDHICLVPQEYIMSYSDALTFEQEFIAKGFEGAMVIDGDEPYYVGRKSNKLLKFKTFKSQDCRIVGFKLGEPGSRNEHRLGAVEVLQEDHTTTCDCGSGFTDHDRDYIWANQDEFLNRTAEIKYQELGSGGKMRFPTFKRWRNDKCGKDTELSVRDNTIKSLNDVHSTQ